MSCAEGKRLSGLFLQAALATRDLRSRDAREQEIENACQYQEDCKRQVTEHAQTCPECGPGSYAQPTTIPRSSRIHTTPIKLSNFPHHDFL
jgi:hypothetical protein